MAEADIFIRRLLNEKHEEMTKRFPEMTFEQFIEQAIGAGSIAIWCGVVSFILFKLIDMVIGLRVNEEEETEGLDLTQHDERGYNL